MLKTQEIKLNLFADLSEEDVQMIEKLLDVDEDGVISNEDLAYFQE